MEIYVVTKGGQMDTAFSSKDSATVLRMRMLLEKSYDCLAKETVTDSMENILKGWYDSLTDTDLKAVELV